MKTKIQLLILLLFSINSFAHKDKFVLENYGNVKVYMRTGFNYSDLDKIKIIGKLSEKLSKNLNYKDTILIEYIQDYTNVLTDDLYLLEYNNSNFKLVNGLEETNSLQTNNTGLSVRIYANKIKILDILKFVEYLIYNKEETNNYLTKREIKLNNYEDKQVLETLIYEATDKSLIEKIISKESILIKNLINEKFVVKSEEYYGIEIYWKNDKFIFEYKLFDEDQYQLHELKDYYYCIPVNINEILVFTDESSFYFINGNKEKNIKLNKIKNGNNVPIGIIDLDNKILIFDFYNRGNINIFLKNKNKVISKFN
ncbi:hypothetical protein [Flavobacterium proteolyticum]|uniref:Uncharacterized protein n=1 Tax=Flavobacterium proteolyticum TaxID=2911683 RepID=A0ABR9WS17_9FLAO|nr:hypothetical protein [Flavobacterium proteolyticum]MBE9576722.1 hypothetical protein [Flavobacterium proteolyticum]